MKYIWQDKRPRVKFKIMGDAKERGGLQVPNLKLYFDAVCLTWIKDWITLDSKKILNLEGFNRRFGWHAYLQYDKYKVDGHFTHHYIRQLQLKTWLKYKKYLPKETPPWILPQEMITPIIKTKQENWLTYGELIIKKDTKEFNLKTEEELYSKINWLEYLQIKDLFQKDKKELGFRLETSELEKILLETEKKLISKTYKNYWNGSRKKN